MVLKATEVSKLTDDKMDELIRQAKAPTNGQMVELNAQIRAFETRYEMTSEQMKAKFNAGALPDTAEISQWLILLYALEHGR